MGTSSKRAPGAAPPCERTVLENGLTIATERLTHVRSVALGVWGRTGSRDEVSGQEGTAHLLEHMLFKGTPSRSAFQIAFELERLGGYLNAFTSKDHTCYYTRILDEHLPAAIEVLGDMIQHPRIDPTELEREKQVVLEEISTAMDTPDDWVHELFYADLFGSQSLAHPVLGSEATVAALVPEQLRRYVEQGYRPANLLIAAAGSLDHKAVVEQIARIFTDLPVGPARQRPPPITPNPGGRHLHPRDISQVHVLLGGPGVAYRNRDRYPLIVLLNLLAGGMSSRLFQSLREQRGLVYTISSQLEFFVDTGVLAFYFACAPGHVEEARELIHQELLNLGGATAPNEQEVASAKEQLKGQLMLSLESTFNRMSRLARGLLFEQRVRSLEEILNSIATVSRDDLVRISGQLLVPERLTTTMLGAVALASREGATA